MITHLCKTCEASVTVARVDITTMTSGPTFVWGMHEQCTCCGSTARPLEVVDANDKRLGMGQWESA